MDKSNDVISGATQTAVPPAGAHHAGDGGAGVGPVRRMSAKRKLAAVQRVLRGESMEAVSRSLGVPVHRLSEWRDRALQAAEGALMNVTPKSSG